MDVHPENFYNPFLTFYEDAPKPPLITLFTKDYNMLTKVNAYKE